MRTLVLSLTLLFVFSSCKKKTDEIYTDTLERYSGLDRLTVEELRVARNATARYLSLDSALKDGYADIAVDVEEMGHHYMKAALVDGNFELTKPEILVYNRDEQGKAYLVAIEYAVPLNCAKPEGFNGSADVWNGSTGFQLWLLHAWVWSYNPEGVFNPTNPLVHLH